MSAQLSTSSIEQLNAAASAWSNAWNANLIPGQDTRLRREGLAEPVARFDLWQRIRADQLLLLPPVEVCRAFMTAKEETRKVRPDLSISFKHPQAERKATYSLRGLDGVCSGDEVGVCAMVFGDCAIQITVPSYNGEDRLYRPGQVRQRPARRQDRPQPEDRRDHPDRRQAGAEILPGQGPQGRGRSLNPRLKPLAHAGGFWRWFFRRERCQPLTASA